VKKSFIAFALGLSVIATMPAYAQQGRLDKIKASSEIAIGYRDTSIPFSYLDDKQAPVGYTMDMCRNIVAALQKKLGVPKINIKLVAVTSSTRIPLIANGAVDLVCGSSTNTIERQAQVSFAPTTFITATRFVSKKASNIPNLDALKGKIVVSTAGTSNIKWLTTANQEQKLNLKIIPVKDHAEAMLTVQNGRALAFFMDDILLAGLVATSRDPAEWVISKDAYTFEPYAIMEPKNDPDFKKAVDDTVVGMMKDGTVEKLYKKWFQSAIPPKGVNLNLPMSAQLKRAIASPSDSASPNDYK
jgi:glutamate/aspartate transport system substrate-binding protein